MAQLDEVIDEDVSVAHRCVGAHVGGWSALLAFLLEWRGFSKRCQEVVGGLVFGFPGSWLGRGGEVVLLGGRFLESVWRGLVWRVLEGLVGYVADGF